MKWICRWWDDCSGVERIKGRCREKRRGEKKRKRRSRRREEEDEKGGEELR